MKTFLKYFYITIIFVSIASSAAFAKKQYLFLKEKYDGTLNSKVINYYHSVYYSNDKIMIYSEPQSRILILLNKKIVYLISDTKMKYYEISLDQFKSRHNMGLGFHLETLTDKDILIKETGRKKKINGYNCFEVIVVISSLSMKISLWLTKDAKESPGLYFSSSSKIRYSTYFKLLNNIMEKYKAYAVESFFQMNNNYERGTLKVTLEEISGKPVSPSVFRIPEGYSGVKLK